MKNWIRKQFRKKSRVYIIPTKMGGYFNGLIFLMFLLSVGYSNNLLLIFTILLFVSNLMWLIQTHFHLYHLKFDQVLVEAGHAGKEIPFQALWKKTPEGPWDWELEIENSFKKTVNIKQVHNDQYKSVGEFLVNKRGVVDWTYLKIKSTRPFGLYQAWIYYPLKAKSYIYPPLLPGVQISGATPRFEGEMPHEQKGDGDFRGFAHYASGDSKFISWKNYARTGQLLIKEGEDQKAQVIDFYLRLPTGDEEKELYLSELATKMVDCFKKEIGFSLLTPDQNFPAAKSYSHLTECLKVLSQC